MVAALTQISLLVVQNLDALMQLNTVADISAYSLDHGPITLHIALTAFAMLGSQSFSTSVPARVEFYLLIMLALVLVAQARHVEVIGNVCLGLVLLSRFLVLGLKLFLFDDLLAIETNSELT